MAINVSYSDYEKLIRDLNEAGRLRNLVVHADWENTDKDGYTSIKLNIKKGSINQEYIQFSENSLNKIIELVNDTQENLYEYWEWRNDELWK